MPRTTDEEIQRQHQKSLVLVDGDGENAKPMPCAPRNELGEIPLTDKAQPTYPFAFCDTTKDETQTQTTDLESSDSESSSSSFSSSSPAMKLLPLPSPSALRNPICWSTRGFVDVSKLQEMVREGYNCDYRNLEQLPKPSHDRCYNYWDPRNADKDNVTLTRPSHDAWGIGKIVLVFSDDFLTKVYQFPWWKEFEEALQPILDAILPQDNNNNGNNNNTGNNTGNNKRAHSRPLQKRVRGCCAIGLVEDSHLRLECEPPIPVFPRDCVDTRASQEYWMPACSSSSSWKRIRQLYEGGWGRLPIDKTFRLDKLRSVDFRGLVGVGVDVDVDVGVDVDEGDSTGTKDGVPAATNTTDDIVVVRGAFGRPFVDAIRRCCGRYTPRKPGNNNNNNGKASLSSSSTPSPANWNEIFKEFDHRRFVTFGVVNGLLTRVHSYPFFHGPFPAKRKYFSNYDSNSLPVIPPESARLHRKKELTEERNFQFAQSVSVMMDGTMFDDELVCIFEKPYNILVELVEKYSGKKVAQIFARGGSN
mmetsp:Transcript_8294/g.16089  ORF Transcript_8294/g.16089 Transcript_8294/m.16089 type:complete len:531 (+) Transcript_8294:216-1808(+)